jgi:hypothetical protein
VIDVEASTKHGYVSKIGKHIRPTDGGKVVSCNLACRKGLGFTSPPSAR